MLNELPTYEVGKYVAVHSTSLYIMELPAEIAAIIVDFDVRKLTVSEKRKLLLWYQQLDSGADPRLSEEDKAAIEEKIFQRIANRIVKPLNPKGK